MRKRIRRAALAEQFCVNVRTIDAWSKTGALPPPHYMPGSRMPMWYEDEIDRSSPDQSDKVEATR
jgi:hypothetical protein